jgi:hypothetical protein
MVKINKLGVVLQNTTHNFECEGVLNPPYFIRKPTTNSRVWKIPGLCKSKALFTLPIPHTTAQTRWGHWRLQLTLFIRRKKG